MNTPRKAQNLDLLVLASERLQPLLDRLVFVGGATTGLLISDPADPDIRPTRDVDVIVEIQHYGEYHALEKQLRELGFRPSQEEGAPLCRFEHDNLILDIMPTDERILGFSNRWYEDAVQTAITCRLPNDLTIRHTTAPFFIATKLEAFEGRGHKDYMASHDFEDVIAVISGRPELLDEIRHSSDELQRYISEKFSEYLKDRRMLDALPGIILDQEGQVDRSRIVLERMKEIANK